MKILPLFLAILVFGLPLTSGSNNFAPAKAQESNEQTQRVLDIERVVSPGGIEAWLVSDTSLPVLSMAFAFEGAGARNETPETQGTAQILSNMLDEGAGDLVSQDFQRELEENSIRLSFSSGRDDFSGSLKTLTRNQDKAFDLLSLALKEPRFDAEPLQRMIEANTARLLSSRASPEWQRARLANARFYEGHPYALNSGGTLSTLPRITGEALKNYKENHLTRERLQVTVAGDITAETLAPLLDRIFSGLPENENKTETVDSSFQLQNKGQISLFERDIPQTLIEVAIDGPAVDASDYHAFRLANYIFGGGGFGSRLMEEVREKRGLSYGIYSSLTNMDQIDLLSISTSTQRENTNEVLNLINSELNMFPETIKEEKLQQAKDYFTGSLPLSLTSSDNIVALMLNMKLKDYPIDYLDSYQSMIDGIGLDDVREAAAKYLHANETSIVLVGGADSLPADKTRILHRVKELPNVD